jgi:hypothetical protein
MAPPLEEAAIARLGPTTLTHARGPNPVVDRGIRPVWDPVPRGARPADPARSDRPGHLTAPAATPAAPAGAPDAAPGLDVWAARPRGETRRLRDPGDE